MSVSQSIVTGMTVFTFAISITGTCRAWQQPAEPVAEQTEAAKLLDQIRSHIESDNWQGVADSMTDDAWDRWSAQLVVECISIAQMDMGFELPGMEEAQDKILEALEKHGLDEIEIQRPSIEIRSDHEPDEDEEQETDADNAQRDAQEKDVLDHLGEGMKRTEIISDLWKAKSSSPLSTSVFLGKITQEIAGENGLIIKVKPSQPEPPSEAGVSIIISIPPVFLNLEQHDDVWKFAGVNEQKTEEARKNFQPEMPRDRESDF